MRWLLAGGYLGARLQIAAYARRVGRLVPGIGKLA
jgi:hypothetical protein